VLGSVTELWNFEASGPGQWLDTSTSTNKNWKTSTKLFSFHDDFSEVHRTSALQC